MTFCPCGQPATHKFKGVDSCDRCTRRDLSSGLYGEHLHRNGQKRAVGAYTDTAPSCLEPDPIPTHVLDMFAWVERVVAT